MLDFDFNKRYICAFKGSAHEWVVNRDSNYKPTYENCSSALGTLRDLEKYIRIIRSVAGTEEQLKEAKFDAQYIVDGYFNKMGCLRKIYDYVKRFFGYKVEQDEIRELNIQIQSKGRTFSEVLSKDLFYYVSKWLSYQDIARLARASKGCKLAATSMLYSIAKEFGYPDKGEYKSIISYLRVVNDLISEMYNRSLFKPVNDCQLQLKTAKDLNEKNNTKFYEKISFILNEKSSSSTKLYEEIQLLLIDIFDGKSNSTEIAKQAANCLNDILYNSFPRNWTLINFLAYHVPLSELELYLHDAFYVCTLDSCFLNKNFFECLIERGVDINCVDRRPGYGNGKTLLDQAIQGANLEAINWLLNHGANPKSGS